MERRAWIGEFPCVPFLICTVLWYHALMPDFGRVVRLLLVVVLGILITAVSAFVANEVVGGSGEYSRIFTFAHRVPVELNGYGTEYAIGRVHIIHHERFINPIEKIGFDVDGGPALTLVGADRTPSSPRDIITAAIEERFRQVPADIRADWSAAMSGLVQVMLRDGPGAALAVPNQHIDETLTDSIPESGLPIAEDVFRQGRIVIYHPLLKVTGANPLSFLGIWLVTVVILALITKRVADAISKRRSAMEPRP